MTWRVEAEDELVAERRGDHRLRVREGVRKGGAEPGVGVLGGVELGRIEGCGVELRGGNLSGELPGRVRGKECSEPVVEEEQLRVRRVVGRSHESGQLLVEPDRRVRLAPGHEHRRPILQRDTDDARRGKALLETVSEKDPRRAKRRRGAPGRLPIRRQRRNEARLRILRGVHRRSEHGVEPAISDDAVIAGIEARADRRVPGRRERHGVAMGGMREDRALLQESVEAALAEPGAKALEVVRAHLVDGDHEDERRLVGGGDRPHGDEERND